MEKFRKSKFRIKNANFAALRNFDGIVEWQISIRSQRPKNNKKLTGLKSVYIFLSASAIYKTCKFLLYIIFVIVVDYLVLLFCPKIKAYL